jgi:hypothetical protein
MTPEQKFRWVVDRMNDVDWPIEQAVLGSEPLTEAEKYEFIIFILDSADTGLMRSDFTTYKGVKPSDFVRANEGNPGWAVRLEALGKLRELVVPTLQWLEGSATPGGPNRYFEHNADFTNEKAIPILMESECMGEKIRAQSGR